MEMMIVHLNVIMVMGKETIRRLDLLELRRLENLIQLFLKSRMDGESYITYSDVIVIQHYGEA